MAELVTFLAIVGTLVGCGLFFVARLIYTHLLKDRVDMENARTRITQSLTFKGLTIAALIAALLIPGSMIQNLIQERQDRSRATVQTINEKWSRAQTLCAPVLLVPYTTTKLNNYDKPYTEEHTLYVTPKDLKVTASLTPEERYYGIYKAIVYRSDIHFSGNFSGLADLKVEDSVFHFDKAQIAIGISDLKGVTQTPAFKVNGKMLEPTVGVVRLFGASDNAGSDSSRYGRSHTSDGDVSGKTLVVDLKDSIVGETPQQLIFDGMMKLNGSGSISFIPVGQNTSVTLNGQWPSPSFIGGFSPESKIDSGRFEAAWNILSFNREIPESWSNNSVSTLGKSSFGVNLIETVDHYQQNMRSAKYALMFISLTFIVFFFVEVFTKKSIQFFQYVLVGIALILFYSLLLSLSEQVGFGMAYLVASAATITLTTVYLYSLIRRVSAALILAGVMLSLYTFLYVILQVEDFALLFGSIFLFVVLGVIMFVSNKIKLGKPATASAAVVEGIPEDPSVRVGDGERRE